MSENKVLVTEKCGTLGRVVHYRKDRDSVTIVSFDETQSIAKSILNRAVDALRDVFLPHGYPDSVSQDYADYQIWDTVQAFCSTITGTFTTHAVLTGIGVGDAEATPFAAAITWVLKDGTGMIGRILFAWLKGNSLDSDCKKWRLFADVINDAAMFIELLLPHFASYSTQVLCVTSSMKALVGVAGSATRAAITQHQAISGNMADVSAKDGSQETCVNLLASFVGIFLLALLTNDVYKWIAFILFVLLHLLANYYAVCSLKMGHLNTARLLMVLKTYFSYYKVSNPAVVNGKEPVILGFGAQVKTLCGFDVKMGASLKKAVSQTLLCELEAHAAYHHDKYIVIPAIRERAIYVGLEKGESAKDVIGGYFYATMLGVALCIFNDFPLDNIQIKRKLHQATPLTKLTLFMKKYPKNELRNARMLHPELFADFNRFVKAEIQMFYTALKVNGWTTDAHSIQADQWRADWKSHLKKYE